ncbi:MAG TPA: hypothetical protein VGE81_10310 [Candidatus Limnocylindrales bacterium]|jgi:hypothetical protein
MFSLPGRRSSPAIIALGGAIFMVVGFAGAGMAVAIVGLALLVLAAVQFLMGSR